MYEPRQVPIGKQCGCVCPACSRPVYAKHCRGGKRAPHFAHAPGADCASATETSIHLAAKQLIHDRKSFFFPALIASVEITDAMGVVHRPSRTVWAADRRELLNVELERTVTSIRPDVLVDLAGFGKVAIEIAVTHFTDESKTETLRELGLAAVEVDLSGVRDATFEVLEALLLSDGGAGTWLYHPAMETAEASLLAELEPALAEAHVLALKAKRALEEKRMLEHERQRKAAQDSSAKRRDEILDRTSHEAEQKRRKEAQQRKTDEFFAATENEKREILLRWLGGDTLPASLHAPLPWKSSFGVSDPHIWQTALFVGLIHKRPARGLFLLTFDTAFKWLRERFGSSFASAELDEMALREYLKALTDRGALLSRRQGYFLTGVVDLASFDALQFLRKNLGMPVQALANRAAWVEEKEWPRANQPAVMATVMSGAGSLSGGWYRLSIIQDSVREASPYRICEWGATVGIDELRTLEFLVRTGFLRFVGSP